MFKLDQITKNLHLIGPSYRVHEIRDQFNCGKPKEKDLDQSYKQVINKTYLLGIVNYSSVLVANHSKRHTFLNLAFS